VRANPKTVLGFIFNLKTVFEIEEYEAFFGSIGIRHKTIP